MLGSMPRSARSIRRRPSYTAQYPFTAQRSYSVPGGQSYWPPQYANPAVTFVSKDKVGKWSKYWLTHIFFFVAITLFSAGGALLFKTIEEEPAKQNYRNANALRLSLFQSMQQLAKDFETRRYEPEVYDSQLNFILRHHEAAVKNLLYEKKKKIVNIKDPWSFWNAVFFCGTIYTSIGYGYTTPITVVGKALTIIYAIIGIPLFLILLADFGKLYTRCLKFVWAYVRRLYYTGNCRKIRKHQQVREALVGINAVYAMALRRPKNAFDMDAEKDFETSTAATSTYPETFEIDDEFNLPISVASILLLSYILIGAFVYTLWENWSYFDAFYFVFLSVLTIGLDEPAPQHIHFLMCSIVYLVFGLALTSMFINVVKIKLSHTFEKASAKIAASMGFDFASEMSEEAMSQLNNASEFASIHGSRFELNRRSFIQMKMKASKRRRKRASLGEQW